MDISVIMLCNLKYPSAEWIFLLVLSKDCESPVCRRSASTGPGCRSASPSARSPPQTPSWRDAVRQGEGRGLPGVDDPLSPCCGCQWRSPQGSVLAPK